MTTLTAPRRRKVRRECQYVIAIGDGVTLIKKRCGKPVAALHIPHPAWRCAAHRDAEACCVAVSEARSAA